MEINLTHLILTRHFSPSPSEWKAYAKAHYINLNEYITNQKTSIDDLKKKWSEFKTVQHLDPCTIAEYEQKIKECDSSVDSLKEILFEEDAKTNSRTSWPKEVKDLKYLAATKILQTPEIKTNIYTPNRLPTDLKDYLFFRKSHKFAAL
jgi:transposase